MLCHTRDGIAECQAHNAEQKEPGLKGHGWHDPTYTTFQEREATGVERGFLGVGRVRVKVCRNRPVTRLSLLWGQTRDLGI